MNFFKNNCTLSIIYYPLLLIILSAVSCKPVKKVQQIETAISRKDTAQRITITPPTRTEVKENKIDSFAIIKGIAEKVKERRINFQTFNAKTKVEYEDKNHGAQATANIRIQKDSIIWISLTGPFNIEGYRLIVTKDSVKLMNMLNKTVQLRSVAYLQELAQLPFDFFTLQDLIIGNPIFINDNVISFKNAENRLEILFSGSVFKNLLTLTKEDNRIVHSKLDDVNPTRNRTCDISYNNYENTEGILFSSNRKISVSEQSRLDVSIDFKKYQFDQPLTFPFNVPKTFKRK